MSLVTQDAIPATGQIQKKEFDPKIQQNLNSPPNPGGDKIIIPVRAICIIDQAKVQSNSFCDLNIHYDIGGGVGGYGVNTLLHIRRFMWNQSSDIIYYVPGPNGLKVGTTTASAVNKAVQVSVDSEIYGPSGPGDDNVLNASNIWISYYIINMA